MTNSLHSEICNMVGKPWVSGASGKDAFDCWGVIEYVYSLLGLKLNFNFDFDHDNDQLVSICMMMQKESEKWKLCEDVKDYDVVLMYEGDRPTHVGLWIDGKILHSIKSRSGLNGGVCLHNSLTINRMFEKIEFYRPS